MNRIDHHIRRSVISQGLTMVLRLATSVLLARFLGPVARGRMALALWVPGVFNSLFYLGLGEGSVPLMNRGGHRREEVLGSLTVLSVFSIVIGSFVYFGFEDLVLRLLRYELPIGLYRLAFPLFPITVLWAGWALVHLSLGNVMCVNWGRAMNQGVLLLILMLTLLLLPGNAGLAVAAALVGAVVELLWVGSWLFAHVPLRLVWSPSLQRQQLRLGAPSALALWIGILSQRLDLILVTWVGGAAGAGFYAVALGLRDFALVLPETFLRPILSESAQSHKKAWYVRIGPSFRLALLLLAMAACLLSLLMPWMVRVLYSTEFLPVVNMARWLLVGFVAFGASNILSAALTGLGRMIPFVISQLAGVAVLVPAALWLGRIFGIDGVAMAVSASQWTALGALLLLIRRQEPTALRVLFGFGARP